MKIWIDILTPKQLLFAEPIVERLGKKNEILCTSRRYEEVSRLAKIRGFDLVYIGKYGGGTRRGKLESSIHRMRKIAQRIEAFEPNVAVNFCSPDAARVAFGLGIRQIAMCDSPFAEASMRLTVPLLQKLLIPSAIPKRDFSRFGIDKKDIITYNAIDASVLIKRGNARKGRVAATPFGRNAGKNIVIRVEEDQAAYRPRSKGLVPIIRRIADEFADANNIVILARYQEQIKRLRKEIAGKRVRITKMSSDGKSVLEETDVFVGSGGTMTAEAGLMGVPNISYNPDPNAIEKYLARNRLVTQETDPQKISAHVKRMLAASPDRERQRRAKEVLSGMEDPIETLVRTIND